MYPEIEPFETGMMSVDSRHQLYWEQSGNPNGIPVLFLHGGPGACSSPKHRQFFNPDKYRIVIFDQRGCGKSIPHADITDNTTEHLIQDIEQLRRFLCIPSMVLFGGSWGSTLALAYGLKYPDRVRGFILRGIFLGSKEENDGFINGMGNTFPEAHREFVNFLSEYKERDNILPSYYSRLTNPDPLVHMPAAHAWAKYEDSCAYLNPIDITPDDKADLAVARIECHYFINDMFMPTGWPWMDLHTVRHIPCAIVQGRYDVVCPIITADKLALAWPEADYNIVTNAGHSAFDPALRRKLIQVTDNMLNKI